MTARIERMRLWVVAAVAMAVAAATTLVGIGRQPLSWDEAVTLEAAQRRPAELIDMLHHTDAPLGLYYAGMHVWVGLGDRTGIGSSAGWLRLPSALAAIAAVGILVTLVAGWFDRRTALLSGLLLAVHPLLTFYGQDARPYTLVTCAFLAATWLLRRALLRPDVGRLAAYTLVSIVALYLHFFVVYAFAAHVVLVARRRIAVRRWLVVGATLAVAVTPLVLVARHQSGEISWIGRPSASQVLAVVEHVMGGSWLGALLLAMAGLALARHPRRSPVFALGIWAIFPLAALIAVDLFVLPDLVARYALVSIPALVTLAVLAVRRSRGPLGSVVVALVLALAVVATWGQHSQPFKYENYRAADDTMGDLAGPGDGVMFLPASMRAGFDIYRHLEPDLTNVHDLALAPGGSPTETDLIGGQDQPADRIASLFAGAPRVFVLGNALAADSQRPVGATERAELAVLHGYRVIGSMRWGVVYLTVLQRKG
jgi:mannosyltransferase